MARLKGMGIAQNKLAEMAKVVPIKLVPEDPAILDRITEEAVSHCDSRHLLAQKASRKNQPR